MKKFIEQRYNFAFYPTARLEIDDLSGTSAIVPGSNILLNGTATYTALNKHIFVDIISVPKQPLTNNEIPAPWTTSASHMVVEINTLEYLKSRAIDLMNIYPHQWIQYINHNTICQKEGITSRRCSFDSIQGYYDSARYDLFCFVLEIQEDLDGD